MHLMPLLHDSRFLITIMDNHLPTYALQKKGYIFTRAPK